MSTESPGRPELEVRIEPVEPLLFGDNRSARIGEDHILGSQDPSPITVYGAVGGRICAALDATVKDWEVVEPVLGPFAWSLAEYAGEKAALLGYAPVDAEGRSWFPQPQQMVFEDRLAAGEAADEGGDSDGRWVCRHRATPTPHRSGEISSLGRRERLAGATGGKKSAGYFWVDESLLRSVLTGRLSAPDESQSVRRGDELWRQEGRIGLTVSNDTGAGVEGRLFGRPYRRYPTALRAGTWCSAGYTAWYRPLGEGDRPVDAWSGVGYFGGDRGRAFFEFRRAAALADLRDAVIDAADGSAGFLFYLLTPAVLEARSFPPELAEPVAEAVGKPLRVSGWNGARGPRPLRVLLPAGTTYFWRWGDRSPDQRRRLLADHWLDSLNPELSDIGFGRVLTGVWREGGRES